MEWREKGATSQVGMFTNCTVIEINDEKDVQGADGKRGGREDCWMQ